MSSDSRHRWTDYDRPGDRWVCGDASRGAPCPFGPQANGLCSRQADCQPQLIGGRWQCTRAECFGGPCASGPTSTGTCGQGARQCTPRANWRWLRTRVLVGVVALTVGAVLLALRESNRRPWIAPGPMSSNHSATLSSLPEHQRCEACHERANEHFSQWLTGYFRSHPALVDGQTGHCLKCHREHLSEYATFAHSVSPLTLDASRQSAATVTRNVMLTKSRGSDSTQQFACAMCHHEHQGDAFKHTQMSDGQCATCHQDPFRAFPDAHPEFQRWPSGSSLVHFPHALHEQKHFPAAKRDFNCDACHLESGKQEVTRVTGYQACATCHDRTIAAGSVDGLPLIKLPLIEPESLGLATSFAWPAMAQGGFDGPIVPWLQLILASDVATRDALSELGIDFDFLDLDESQGKQRTAARLVVQSTAQLLAEIANDPRDKLVSRLSQALNRTLTRHEADTLWHGLPDDFLQSTVAAWFSATVTPASSPTHFHPSSDEEPVTDDLLEQSSTTIPSSPEALAAKIEAPWEPSGWQRNLLAGALSYRPQGHADPVVRLLIELTNPQPGRASSVEPIVNALRNSNVIKQCTNCHQPNRFGRVQWKAVPSLSIRSFTRFVHAPHLTQVELRQCSHCHRPQAQPTNNSDSSTELAAQLPTPSDFSPLTKHDCAECHRPHLVRSDCKTCHRYHVQERQ